MLDSRVGLLMRALLDRENVPTQTDAAGLA